jgi:hypothetical protein
VVKGERKGHRWAGSRCVAQSHWKIPAFGYINNQDHRLVEPGQIFDERDTSDRAHVLLSGVARITCRNRLCSDDEGGNKLKQFVGQTVPTIAGRPAVDMAGRACSIPWEAISAHEHQARANHGQSLDALAQRGGLSPYELLAVLFDQPFWRGSFPEPATVIKKLKEKMAGFEG